MVILCQSKFVTDNLSVAKIAENFCVIFFKSILTRLPAFLGLK